MIKVVMIDRAPPVMMLEAAAWLWAMLWVCAASPAELAEAWLWSMSCVWAGKTHTVQSVKPFRPSGKTVTMVIVLDK